MGMLQKTQIVNLQIGLEKTFATEHEADEFIARQYQKRETVREGKLTK